MPADPPLIALFARGWALTRNVAPPVDMLGGQYIEVGQPDQKARYIFPKLIRRILADLAAKNDEPYVYLKVCEREDLVRSVLPPHWQIRQPATWMMTRPLARSAVNIPADYTFAITGDGPVRLATISFEAAAVAQGRIALLGDTVLFDQIAVDETHRRRGLGRMLMQSLSNLALDECAPNGLLSATEMGRALYETIGWVVHSPYTSAVIPR